MVVDRCARVKTMTFWLGWLANGGKEFRFGCGESELFTGYSSRSVQLAEKITQKRGVSWKYRLGAISTQDALNVMSMDEKQQKLYEVRNKRRV